MKALLHALFGRRKELELANARLRTALEFYAYPLTWKRAKTERGSRSWARSDAEIDKGATASAALAGRP